MPLGDSIKEFEQETKEICKGKRETLDSNKISKRERERRINKNVLNDEH